MGPPRRMQTPETQRQRRMLQTPAQSRQTQNERSKVNELALFAGAGGGILGGMLLGWRTVAAVEIEDYPRRVLLQRQADGILHRFPIWDDVTTFDGHPWRGKVDVISGGFPCQDISSAGKGAGITGSRSGLWGEMARIIGEVRPRFVFVENSPVLTSRGLGTVLGDLAKMGYDAKWGVLGACDASAPHKRNRIWIVAHTNSVRQPQPERSISNERGRAGDSRGGKDVADSESTRLEGHRGDAGQSEIPELGDDGSPVIRTAPSSGLPHWLHRSVGEPGADAQSERSDWWATEPELGRVAHGVANRVDRLKSIGNGQVPAVAQLAFNILKNEVNI
jgi:DNA (cytosine-5)-methyltransferase 1